MQDLPKAVVDYSGVVEDHYVEVENPFRVSKAHLGVLGAHLGVTAGYFYDTFAYEICFYGIYFCRIYIYWIYFYRALKFVSINCTVVKKT
jgi:hypothetical protein